MKNRHNTYNETLDYIDSQVKAGNTFLIQPKHKSNVGRIEKDRTKLEMLYREGYQDAAGCYESLLKFLEDDK
ncbi:MAG: hypothetical protein K2P25_12155 [Lachnospiraceae bacterium]|nr:hypothetical protein [Lachnospiraceae bacterium]